jgi:hypothetical protein
MVEENMFIATRCRGPVYGAQVPKSAPKRRLCTVPPATRYNSVLRCGSCGTLQYTLILDRNFSSILSPFALQARSWRVSFVSQLRKHSGVSNGHLIAPVAAVFLVSEQVVSAR